MASGQRRQVRQVDIDDFQNSRRHSALGDVQQLQRGKPSLGCLLPLRACVCEQVFTRELRQCVGGVCSGIFCGVGNVVRGRWHSDGRTAPTPPQQLPQRTGASLTAPGETDDPTVSLSSRPKAPKGPEVRTAVTTATCELTHVHTYTLYTYGREYEPGERAAGVPHYTEAASAARRKVDMAALSGHSGRQP